MRNNKKAFVLLETIVVITVLCVILIVLYASYSKILINVKNTSFYDNTEYIAKTELIREYIESESTIMNQLSSGDPVEVYCSDALEPKCNEVTGKELFEFLKVKGVYITKWDIDVKNAYVLQLEPTTQNYIKKLDATSKGTAYRIIVMFKSENDELSPDYEYASLMFRERD